MDTKTPKTHSPLSSSTSSRRKINNDYCNSSPEFEFWMLRNPSFPQPNILSADQLFLNGVILPLHLLSIKNKPDPSPDPQPDSSSSIKESNTINTTSKRWKDIFKKKNNNNSEQQKVKKKDKKFGNGGCGGGGGVSTSAELNINLWPFYRSKSAGNSGTRPKSFNGAPVTRKVNSAPCSRSNSAGDSKSRKCPSSPGRTGVHLGRNSPVWQTRRGSSASKNKEPVLKRERSISRRSRLGAGGGSSKAKVLSLNVPMCIGYSHQFSCRNEENSVSNGGKLFNLRTFFTKKNVVTSH